jgi:hypothetical protein
MHAMRPTTDTHCAASPTVWKLSGYAQSVMGHGRQQVTSEESGLHSRPSTKPPWSKRLSWMKGGGHLFAVKFAMSITLPRCKRQRAVLVS